MLGDGGVSLLLIEVSFAGGIDCCGADNDVDVEVDAGIDALAFLSNRAWVARDIFGMSSDDNDDDARKIVE